MHKRLFNQYDAINGDGNRLLDDVGKVVHPIVKQWIAEDYDGRDIQAIVALAINGICAEEILRRAIKIRRQERNSTVTNQ